MNAIEAIKKYNFIYSVKARNHNKHPYNGKVYANINESNGYLEWIGGNPLTINEILFNDWDEYDFFKSKDEKISHPDKYKISRIYYDTENLSQHYFVHNYKISFFDIVFGMNNTIDNHTKTRLNTNVMIRKSVPYDFKLTGISYKVRNIKTYEEFLLQENCIISIMHNQRNIISYPLWIIPNSSNPENKNNFLEISESEIIKTKDIFYPEFVIENPEKLKFLNNTNILFSIKLNGICYLTR